MPRRRSNPLFIALFLICFIQSSFAMGTESVTSVNPGTPETLFLSPEAASKEADFALSVKGWRTALDWTKKIEKYLRELPYTIDHSLTQFGKASWYGGYFHGRRTASGERFDMNEMTAAHKKLPFGTKVLVTRLDNEKSVIVKITDRGPYVAGRIIDLSRTAAKALGLLKSGVAKVRIDVIIMPDRDKE